MGGEYCPYAPDDGDIGTLAMHDPGSSLASETYGAANVRTAGICVATHGQPASVCMSAGVARARGLSDLADWRLTIATADGG